MVSKHGLVLSYGIKHILSSLLIMGILGIILYPIVVGALGRSTEEAAPVIVAPAVEKELTLDERITLLAEKYGVNEAHARAIIGCESEWRPHAIGYNRNASGEVWSKDISYWQLNDYFHKKDMARLGWDISNPIDNLEAGFYLYSKQGAKPWRASYHCHHIA